MYAILAPDPPRFTVVAATDDYLRAIGRRRGETIGRGLFEILPAAFGEARSILEHAIRSREPQSASALHADRSVKQHCAPMLDGRGEVASVLHRIEDVTDRQRTQQRLNALEAVVAATQDAILVTEPAPLSDPGPRILFVNEAFSRMTGYRPEEVIGKSPRMLQGPATDRGELARLGAALARREPVRVELVNYRKDGTPFWVELRVSPVFDETGQLVHFTSVQHDTTARKEAEQAALRLAREEAVRAEAVAAEQRIAAILESITDAFYAVDSQWRFTYVNRRAEQLLGRPREELLGKGLWEEFPRVRDSKLGREYERAMREQVQVEFEDRPPGYDRWFMIHAYPWCNGLSVYFHDITERRHTAEALRESELRYRTLFENSMDGILLIGPDERVWMSNPACTEIFGYSQEELRRLDRTAVLDLCDLRTQQAIEERRRTGRFRGELSLKRKDGTRFPGEVTSAVFRDETGAEWRSLFVRDITERRHAEEAQSIVSEASRTLAGSLDLEGTLETLGRLVVPRLADFCTVDLTENGATRQVLAVHRDPSRQDALGGLVGLCADALRDAREPRVVTAEALGARAVLFVPLVAHGRRIGCMAFGATEPSRRFERPDVMLAESVAGRAALAMDNARLFEQAQHAAKLRDEVLRIVAHDLRNPLNTIRLTASLLDRSIQIGSGKLSPHQRIEVIQRSVERATRLIQDLLDVAKMESGHLAVQRRPEDPTALLRESFDLHRAVSEETGHRLELSIPEHLPPIDVDRERILQILGNLIGNAIKFTPAGGRIGLRAQQVGNQVQFSVSDTGPGIPEEEIPFLFEPFWQAHGGTTLGAGLGLGISRGLVDAHGGRIWVDTEVGKGSTFHFTVPEFESKRWSAEAHPGG